MNPLTSEQADCTRSQFISHSNSAWRHLQT